MTFWNSFVLLFLLIDVIVNVRFSNDNYKNLTLINVIQINRHGARTPKYHQEIQKKIFFGSTNMQLTINGYRQEQLLGKLMKERYTKKFNFIKDNYDDKEIAIFSSPTQRTVFSAAGFISGLYPGVTIKSEIDEGKESKFSKIPKLILYYKN